MIGDAARALSPIDAQGQYDGSVVQTITPSLTGVTITGKSVRVGITGFESANPGTNKIRIDNVLVYGQ